MATYQEILLKDLDNQLKYLNVAEYHKLGYKGQGLTVLNTEPLDRHGQMTSGVLLDYAPELNIINSAISFSASGDKISSISIRVNGVSIPLEEAIDKYKIKLVTTSQAGKTPDIVLNYFKELQKRKGIIFFCAAGNDGTDGVTGKYTKDDTAIAVGSIRLENGIVKHNNYSSQGDELDFVMFTGRGTGTSSASPALAALVSLLLNRYGDFNQNQCVGILKSLSVDLGDVRYYGYGVPVLPLTDKLEILDKLKNSREEEAMANFKDIEDTRWSKEAIDFCVEKGLLVGFEDGTFRPTEFVTREQMAIILQRIYTK